MAEGSASRQQLVEEHAQRVDVAAGIDAQGAHFRLLRAHVLQRADHRPVLGEEGPLGELLLGRLGHAEVDHLGDRLAVVQRDHHVRRLDVAVDDPLLMRVLDRLADRDRNSSSRWRGERRLSSQYLVIGTPWTSSMTKYSRPCSGGARIENTRDVDMVHHGQRLPLRLEAGDDLPRVHSPA